MRAFNILSSIFINEHWDDLSPAAVTARLASQVYVTSTGYDGLNRATQLTLPAEPGRGGQRPVLLPVYNRAGALAQVSLDGEVLIRQLAYNARGQRLLLARGNGLVTRYTYDKVMFRLQRLRTEGYAGQGLTLTPQSGTTRQDTLYSYDLAGNITATRERAPQSGVGGTDELVRGFTYDALYRLLSATGRENQPTAARPWQQSTRSDGVASTTAYTQRYEYDELGNMQQLRHVASNSANSFTRTFDYGSGANNYLQAVQLGAATVAYQYDAAGNVTQENSSRHYQWDAADQLRQFATWAGKGSAPTLLAYYLYNGGQRVKKLTQTSVDAWQVIVYAEGGFEHRYEVSSAYRTGEQTQVAVFDSQHHLYQRQTGDALGDQRPTKRYALDDHLGSNVAQTDVAGQLVGREEYYPFGETSFGAYQKQRYRYCGKELDEESGLFYYGARYYTPWLCRFISVDPLAYDYDYYTPYQYAGNKPIISVDIDGLEGSNDTGQQVTRGSTENPIPLSTVVVVGHRQPADAIKEKTDTITIGSLSISKDTASTVLHSTLDVVGLIPGFGEAADGANALIYLAEGNTVDASLSLAAMIPLAGAVAVLGKYGRKVQKAAQAAEAVAEHADEAAELAKLAARQLDEGIELAKKGEDLYVGTYNVSSKANRVSGLNKSHTPHHVLQDAISEVSHGRGVTINIEHGIHSKTYTNSRPRRDVSSFMGKNNNTNPLRVHLAADVWELRSLLKEAGYSTKRINRQLVELISQNKAKNTLSRVIPH